MKTFKEVMDKKYGKDNWHTGTQVYFLYEEVKKLIKKFEKLEAKGKEKGK